ncbi:hypothetical protein RSSM_01051 [Rhodopirellula sallentina SM41]|uniref:Uncharacterized protein n=1 Tax=Rhodopirellula sallentina SM41 TaxID=1263870 RepID=M5U7R1_9BACT|nr:hypothetical protein RSSM_01051 [Rhodopirellula sallentina SM41]
MEENSIGIQRLGCDDDECLVHHHATPSAEACATVLGFAQGA